MTADRKPDSCPISPDQTRFLIDTLLDPATLPRLAREPISETILLAAGLAALLQDAARYSSAP